VTNISAYYGTEIIPTMKSFKVQTFGDSARFDILNWARFVGPCLLMRNATQLKAYPRV
jgi:hypothetical protein